MRLVADRRGTTGAVAAAGQREVLDPVAVAVGHDHRALGGVAQRADVAGPIVLDQRLAARPAELARDGLSYLRA